MTELFPQRKHDDEEPECECAEPGIWDKIARVTAMLLALAWLVAMVALAMAGAWRLYKGW